VAQPIDIPGYKNRDADRVQLKKAGQNLSKIGLMPQGAFPALVQPAESSLLLMKQ